MKKLLFFVILVCFIAFSMYKGCIGIATNDTALQTGQMKLQMKRTKIKQIAELATATQTISLDIDTNYNSTNNTDLNLYLWKITLKSELKENRLHYIQRYKAKAGFRDISIYRSDSLFVVESKPVELLSFELVTDSLLCEQGTWTKQATIEMEAQNKQKALDNIRQDSLMVAAQTNYRKYITEIVRNITNTEGFIIQFKTK